MGVTATKGPEMPKPLTPAQRKLLKAEGRKAAEQGLGLNDCPYNSQEQINMRGRWSDGWYSLPR